MPFVEPNLTLRDALEAYMRQVRATKADAAATLGVDPMTLARFLKTGRAIEANRQKLEEGLARVGAWRETPTHTDKGPTAVGSHTIISSDKVIAALEFLLAAARQARAGDRTP